MTSRFPESWKLVPLEDAIEKLIDYRGKTPKKVEQGIPLVTAKIVKKGEVLPPNEFIAPEDYDSWMTRGLPEVGDVVLTVEAPLGEVAQLKNAHIALAQRIVTLRGKKEYLDNTYLKYALMSPFGQSELTARESGSTVKGIKQSELKKVLIPIPPFQEQLDMAKILNDIDEKIRNNTAMNATLEKIAQRIFKSWFVDFDPVKANAEGLPFDGLSPEIQALFPNEFEESELGMIPKGWEVKSLDEIANLDTTSVKPHIHPDQTWVHYSIPSFDEKNYPIIELGSEIKSNKYAVKKNAILVSKLNPRFERTWFPKIEDESIAICSTEFMQLVMKNIDNWPYLLCMVKSNYFQELLTSTATGTTGSRQRAQPKEVIKFNVLVPSENLVERFSSAVKPMFERYRLNLDQISSLTKIRDKLLPRLISGKITIQKAEELLEEAS